MKKVKTEETPQTVARQVPLSMGFPRQEYWSELLFPPPGDLPNPGIESASLMSPALIGRFFTTSSTWEAQINMPNDVYSNPFHNFESWKELYLPTSCNKTVYTIGDLQVTGNNDIWKRSRQKWNLYVLVISLNTDKGSIRTVKRWGWLSALHGTVFFDWLMPISD